MVRREKTTPAHALDNPARRKLVDLVRNRPGARLDDLWKESGVSRGTTQYHLVVLQRVGHIQSSVGDGISRYFPADQVPEDVDHISVLMRGRILEVAELLLRRPGFSQQDATRGLRMSRKVFIEYANLLHSRGLLEEERDHKRKRYYPTSRLEHVVQLVASGEWKRSGGDDL